MTCRTIADSRPTWCCELECEAATDIRVPWEDLRGGAWRLSEMLSTESYERGGDELAGAGLTKSYSTMLGGVSPCRAGRSGLVESSLSGEKWFPERRERSWLHCEAPA
jgi:hypothetical protein